VKNGTIVTLSPQISPVTLQPGKFSNATINQTKLMTINLRLPKWLTRRFARPRPKQPAQPHLKQRQLLPTLPYHQRPPPPRFQDDDSPPGYRIQWRQ
jgi:hypothetical protein